MKFVAPDQIGGQRRDKGQEQQARGDEECVSHGGSLRSFLLAPTGTLSDRLWVAEPEKQRS